MAPANEMKWKDAILTVLRDAGQPMHVSDILQEITDRQLRTTMGASPTNTIYTNIIAQMKRSDDLIKAGPSTFLLRESKSAISRERSDRTKTVDASPRRETSADMVADDDSPGGGLITSLGMYWARDKVDWKAVPRLLGRQPKASVAVDFCEQNGVYVLYDGARPVYAGQAASKSLGTRLWAHTTDRMGGRWNRFSWFGIRPVGKENGRLEAAPPPTAHAPSAVIDAFEALLIEVMETPLNRQRGIDLQDVEYLQEEDEAMKLRQIRKWVDSQMK